MKLYYQLVSVTDIKSALSPSQFSREEIEKAANLFLKAELSIQPLVLKQEGLEAYSVIYGDFVYFAAVRAREIDPRTAETIQAVVVEPKNESALREQVELFKRDSNNVPTKSDDLTSRFNNFEQTIDQRITDLMNQITQENKE
jgi:ParB family chromosome partitioning protein